MAKTETVYTRVEPDIKAGAEAVLSKLGLTPSEAINLFLNQVILNNGLPFEVRIPSMSKDEALSILMAELKKGEDDIASGRVISLEESKARLGVK